MADQNKNEVQLNLLDVIETQYNEQGVLACLKWPLDVNGHIVLGRTPTNEINKNVNNTPDINLTFNSRHNIAYKHATICVRDGVVTLSPSRNEYRQQSIVTFGEESIRFNPGTESEVLEKGICVENGVQYQVTFGKLNYSMFIEDGNLVLEYESTSLISEA